MATESVNQTPPQIVAEYQKTEDFATVYANNVRYESSVWDLKMIFGDLDQSQGKEVVQLHTFVSIPMIKSKIIADMLRLNVEAYELDNGNIDVPIRVIPPGVELEAEQEQNPLFRSIRDLVNKRRAEFIASLDG